jgi:putative endonuclease
MTWTVYLARCRDGSLYTGVTTDPERRLEEHNCGFGAAYTRSRLPVELVYRERAADRSHALRREHAIRQLTRAEKEALALGDPAIDPGIGRR